MESLIKETVNENSCVMHSWYRLFDCNLQEAKEQHRNTKLMNALLRVHREIRYLLVSFLFAPGLIITLSWLNPGHCSPKLAACAAELSSPYPDYAIGYGAVCHLIASSLAFWPVHGWSPGLYHTLLASVQGTSLLTLGPKETCSLLYLLVCLFHLNFYSVNFVDAVISVNTSLSICAPSLHQNHVIF